MKDETLMELAARWDREAKGDNSPTEDTLEGATRDGKDQGNREGKRECADTLRTLVEILGHS